MDAWKRTVGGRATNVRIFGSVARDEADASSDLDLLGVSVDIIETTALRPQDSQVLVDAVAL